MTREAQALKPVLEQLSGTDKRELASFLLESAEDLSAELHPDWDEEIDERIAEIENSSVVGELAEDVIARMRAECA